LTTPRLLATMQALMANAGQLGGWLFATVWVLATVACTEEVLPAGYPEPPMDGCRATFEVRTCDGLFQRDLADVPTWHRTGPGMAGIVMADPEFSTEFELHIAAMSGNPQGLYVYDPEVEIHEWQAVVCWMGCNEYYGFDAVIDFERFALDTHTDLLWSWGTFRADTGLDVMIVGDVVQPACEENVIQVRDGRFACVQEAP
jgi:hypothetical protein